MKHLLPKLGAGLLGIALVGTVDAQNCCVDWSVGANALVWQQGDCTFRFAEREVESQGVAVNTFIQVDNQWDWGVDVFVRADLDCRWYARLGYLWYENSSSRTVNRRESDTQLLVSGNDIAGFSDWNQVRGRQRTRLQHVDLRLGRAFHQGCCGRFDGFVAARYLDLDRTTGVNAVATTAQTAPNKLRNFTGTGYQAGGLGVGLAGECNLGCGINLFGEAAFLGFIGDQKRSTGREVNEEALAQEQPGARLASVTPSETFWVPALEAKIGLNYTYTCGCWEMVAELAWETHHYYHAILTTNEEPPFIDRSIRRNATFGGPSFGLRVGY